MSKCIFFPNYHIAVNECFVNDVKATGYEIIQPADDWRHGKIKFFASSEQNVRHVTYDEWLTMPPMIVVIPCEQHLNDLKRAVEARGNIDTLVYLTAGSDSADKFPYDIDHLISHDLYYHRKSNAKYKILYFNRPKLTVGIETKNIKESFENKQINLFINNLYKGGFEVELPIIEQFKTLWPELKVYGYHNPDGWPQPPLTHELVANAMFTLSPKRRETWGQNVNESMLLATPVIVFKNTLNSTFTEYLLTPDNAIIAEDAQDAVNQINNLTFEQYETLCIQAQTMSNLYCNDEARQKQLKWLFDKI